MRDLTRWLSTLGLGEYVALFDEHKIDLDVLPELTESDLKELEIPLGHRKKLLKAIADLDSSGAPAASSTEGVSSTVSGGAVSEAERRQVTIMFCDLVGSTELSGRMDAEDLRALIADYQDTCREAISEYEGFVARYMGDGVLAYFGYPKSHEDDAERAVLAGLALLDSIRKSNEAAATQSKPALAVRIGIATGLVVVGDLIGEGASQESPVVGETPNIAARLQNLASPNTIVIAHSTRQLTGHAFEYRTLGPRRLKGVDNPITAWQVVRQSAVESRFAATRDIGLMPFVGREEETALLRNRWQRIEEGDGQVVVITGEAGIGKSRLTEEFRASIAAEPHVRVSYQCLPHYQNSAFYPVIAQLERAAGIGHRHNSAEKLDLLDSLLRRFAKPDDADFPLFADLLSIPSDGRYPETHFDPERRKQQCLSALIRQLEYLASDNFVLCIFEDVHWIDPSTLELLEQIVERASSLPVLVIVTCRADFTASWTGQPHSSLLTLSRMDRRQSREMVDQIADQSALPEPLLSEIVSKTDGIPLFIEELTRTLLESKASLAEVDSGDERKDPSRIGIPATLQDSLMARLDSLTVGKSVVQVAAALGREFSHELLTAVCGKQAQEMESALDEITGSGLVFRRGSGTQASYAFKHALVQDVAYQSLLRSARQALHARIASVLIGEFPESVQLQPELVARHFTEGGKTEEALTYWQQAGARAAARAAHAEAIAHYARGIELTLGIEDQEQRATAEISFNLGLAASMRVIDRWDDALKALDHAETAARNFDRAAELAEIHYLRGNLYFPLGRVEECLQEHERSRDVARRVGLLEKEARALGGMGDAYYQRGHMITAGEHFNGCIEICQEHGFEQIEVAYRSMRAITRLYELRFDEVLEDARSAAERAREIHNLRAEGIALQVVSYFLTDTDQFDQAGSVSHRAMKVCQQLGTGIFGASAQAHYGRCLAAMGRRQEGVLLLREAYTSVKGAGLIFVGPTILGYLALATDDPRERAEALLEGERLLDEKSVSHNYLRFYRFAMDTCLEQEDWDETERYATALEEYTRAEPLPWAAFMIERGRTLAAFGRGGRDSAVFAALSRLREQAQSIGFLAPVHALDAALSKRA